MQILRLTIAAAALVAVAFTPASHLLANSLKVGVSSKSDRLSQLTELADTLAREPHCWISNPDNLDDAECYKAFEQAAFVANRNKKLYHDIGVGQGHLMFPPVCDKQNRRSHCTVVLSKGPGVAERLSYITEYYRGIEFSLQKRVETPLRISCDHDTCSLTYL